MVLGDPGKLLNFLATERRHQDAPLGQLVPDRTGYILPRRGDHDSLMRRRGRMPLAAISQQ